MKGKQCVQHHSGKKLDPKEADQLPPQHKAYLITHDKKTIQNVAANQTKNASSKYELKKDTTTKESYTKLPSLLTNDKELDKFGGLSLTANRENRNCSCKSDNSRSYCTDRIPSSRQTSTHGSSARKSCTSPPTKFPEIADILTQRPTPYNENYADFIASSAIFPEITNTSAKRSARWKKYSMSYTTTANKSLKTGKFQTTKPFFSYYPKK